MGPTDAEVEGAAAILDSLMQGGTAVWLPVDGRRVVARDLLLAAALAAREEPSPITEYVTTREWNPKLGPDQSLGDAIEEALADGTLVAAAREEPPPTGPEPETVWGEGPYEKGEDTERPEERPEWLIKVLQQARADLAKAASWIIDVERHERIQTAVQRVADAMRDNELLTERVVHPLIFALEREIERQDEKHGRYEGTMLGRSRLALGTLEDEVAEALKAWRDERAATHWEATRAEVLQVAAVAIRTLRDAL